jgi:transcription termination factor Rho
VNDAASSPGTSTPEGREADPPVPAGEAPRGEAATTGRARAIRRRATAIDHDMKEMQVSDQAQALERSALESKDRGELMTIATAMGGKPGSRAKKADIIDMIFDLAGVTPGDERSSSEASSAEASSDDAAQDDESDAAPADAPAAEQGSADEDVDDVDSDDAGADEQDSAEADDRPPRPRGRNQPRGGQGAQKQRDQSQDGSRQRGQRQDGQRQDGQKQDGQRQDGQKQDGQKQDGGPSDANQDDPNHKVSEQGGGEQGQDGGEPEPGNRRRRRRGRDRGGNQDEQAPQEPVEVDGLLDLRDEGYGFLRVSGYLPSKDDVYVSVKQSRQFSLRKGDRITGASRPASRNEKNPALLRIDTVNGLDPDAARQRPKFDTLTPLSPDEVLRLESPDEPYNMTRRIVDLVSPIGKGQRGMIVSPPKAGKTTIMKEIARSIEANHPDVHLIVLLVDERPEEVTDMARSVAKSEVAASTFDRPPEEHVQVAELTIERAKRLVESGSDVVIILDGITRLARAYNQVAPQSGRIMSGGVDAAALYPPKKIFGAARNLEEGGSLTILATALVETGSRMDEVIFEEFKGTGNMELKLDRRLAERRIFPAIDVDSSSTRHEELLFEKKQLDQVWTLRRVLSGMAAESGNPGAGLELLVDRMKSFRDNDAFLSEIAKDMRK